MCRSERRPFDDPADDIPSTVDCASLPPGIMPLPSDQPYADTSRTCLTGGGRPETRGPRGDLMAGAVNIGLTPNSDRHDPGDGSAAHRVAVVVRDLRMETDSLMVSRAPVPVRGDGRSARG